MSNEELDIQLQAIGIQQRVLFMGFQLLREQAEGGLTQSTSTVKKICEGAQISSMPSE